MVSSCLIWHENEFGCFKRVQDPQGMGATGTLQDAPKENAHSQEHTWGQTGGASGPQLEFLHT